MAVIKCESCNKYYNDSVFDSCPYPPTDGSESETFDFGETTEMTNLEDTTLVTQETGDLGKLASMDNELTSGIDADLDDDPDDQVTVAMVKKDSGLDPVCGWFVCTEGEDKGRDYRIKTERNFIGRGTNMDIMINGDDSISRENHASITFNPRNLKFTVATGEGRGLIYLNGEVIETSTEVSSYDELEIGNTKLVFIPFITESFEWKEDQSEDSSD
jgi:hypothetical protein